MACITVGESLIYGELPLGAHDLHGLSAGIWTWAGDDWEWTKVQKASFNTIVVHTNNPSSSARIYVWVITLAGGIQRRINAPVHCRICLSL